MPVMRVLMHVHVVMGVAVAMMVSSMQVTKIVCVMPVMVVLMHIHAVMDDTVAMMVLMHVHVVVGVAVVA